MQGLSDLGWLLSVWALLLAISTLIGLLIGWYIWANKPPEFVIDLVAAETAAKEHAEALQALDTERDECHEALQVAYVERDDALTQRDEANALSERYRGQLAAIECLVGEAEGNSAAAVSDNPSAHTALTGKHD